MDMDTENQDVRTENSPSPYKALSMQGTPQPLQPISSERQNQQRLPQSPSLPLFLDSNGSPRKSHQPRLSDVSDVKTRIAFINSISQPGSPTRSNSPTKPPATSVNHAAIQRAMLGREEAEGALAALTAHLESAKTRERLVSERVESLMEQLTETRNRQRHERAVYEKEIKLSKKTEYKAELAVIKLQEDLREVRSELESYKARSEHDKTEKEKARQEAFERAYVVAGMTEEMQDLKQRLEIAEQERDAAVAMAASKIAVEEEKSVRQEFKATQEIGEKRKQPTSDVNITSFDEMDLEAPDCPIEVKYAALQTERDYLRRQVQEGQETIHFMNMQCQFKACPCRMAERDGVRFVHDYEYDAKVRARNAKKRKVEEVGSQLPLPKFKSWLQKQEVGKGKNAVRKDMPVQEMQDVKSQQDVVEIHEQDAAELGAAESQAIPAEPVAPLPPAETPSDLHQDSQQSMLLEEAAGIPLPSLQPKEIDLTDDTPEPTAQLEELTQVIVEPSNSTNEFLFSTSTTNNRATPTPMPGFSQSQNVCISDDLFDLSPPKRHMPPRPSTAMGVLTVESPIRLVPYSPETFRQRSLTPGTELPVPTTTRVALNDTSPVRRARQQQRQFRQDARDQSRGRSPAPGIAFPVKLASRHQRDGEHPQSEYERPQTSQGYFVESRNEVLTTTTTTVSLRDDSQQPLMTPTDSEHPASVSSSTPFSVPGTPNMTREQALAQIRARRDRARSVNMRKSAEDGSKTPGSVARRGVNLRGRLDDVTARNFSQASAPGRI